MTDTITPAQVEAIRKAALYRVEYLDALAAGLEGEHSYAYVRGAVDVLRWVAEAQVRVSPDAQTAAEADTDPMAPR